MPVSLMQAAQVLATLDSHIPEGATVNQDLTGNVISLWLANREAAVTVMRALDGLSPRRTMPGYETWRGTVRGIEVRICLATAHTQGVAA